MSDIGNGRAGRADVVIVGGRLGGRRPRQPSQRRSDPLGPAARGRHGLRRRWLSATTCETPRTCRPTPSTSGASPPAVELPPRRSVPRAPRCSAAARPTTPRWRCARDPSDIRDWQRHGLDDWTIEDVDAAFREMENTPDGDDAYHGRTGPFPIRHEKYDDLTSSLRGFIDATAAEGFRRVEDFNGPNPGGVGGYPVNVVDGVRQNTGLVYLTEEVRHRPNLKISGDVLVDRVLFDRSPGGRRAHGKRRRDSCGPGARPVARQRSQREWWRLDAVWRGGRRQARRLPECGVEAAREFRIVRTFGVEADMELPFAAVQQLCSPFLDSRNACRNLSAMRLTSRSDFTPGPTPERFLLSLAVLGLLAEAAQERPLVCLVDDAQWLDSGSARILAFVARRFVAEEIALVFATRELGETFSRLPELHVPPLDARMPGHCWMRSCPPDLTRACLSVSSPRPVGTRSPC